MAEPLKNHFGPDVPAKIALIKTGGVAVQPVWITVTVPADARPGDYRGKVTVGADGTRALEIPLHLAVLDWKLPDSRDFTTHVLQPQRRHRYLADEWVAGS